MTNREDEVGAVHRIEMKVAHAAVDEVDDLLGADSRRNETTRDEIVIEPLETIGEPGRHAGAGAFSEAGGLFEILHRHNARHDWNIDPRRRRDIEKAQVRS